MRAGSQGTGWVRIGQRRSRASNTWDTTPSIGGSDDGYGHRGSYHKATGGADAIGDAITPCLRTQLCPWGTTLGAATGKSSGSEHC